MRYKIEGGTRLEGQVKVGGAKNAMLPLLAILLINDGEVIIENVPFISDVTYKIKLLREIGADIEYIDHSIIKVNFSSVTKNTVECGYGIRTTILLLGGLLSRFHSCKVPIPQGDKIGKRSYDMHIDCLSQMGVTFKETETHILCYRPEKLQAINYKFRQQSVGGTQNAIIMACICEGTTTLNNCAQEVEIEFLCNTLNALGANINGIGTTTLTIKGNGRKLKNTSALRVSVIPDRVQAITYLLAPLFTQGRVKAINSSIHQVLHGAPLHLLAQMGAKVTLEKNSITCHYKKQKPINYCMVQTGAYPGFNTDSHPMFLGAMSLNVKQAMVYENVYENRFQYAQELIKMGSQLSYNSKVIKSKFIDSFQNGCLFANDIRCGATLTLAALNATGVSTIDNICQINRGYENFLDNLQQLGANIKVESMDNCTV